MNKYKLSQAVLLIFLFLLANPFADGQPSTDVIIQAGKPVAEVQPVMWGVFFEDINFAADGGIYAELVKNRSFEFSLPLMGWRQVRKDGNGRVLPTFYSPARPSNPRYVTIVVDAESGSFGLVNEGFRGMGIKKDLRYDFSIMARTGSGKISGMKIELLGQNDEIIGTAQLSGFTGEWMKHSVSFKALKTEQKATMRILFSGRGSVDIDMVSLFPSDTWKGRPGGLRRDIVQLIADLQPGFLRFPGGCIVEGRDLANRYQWKKTVGPVDERTMIMNRWNVEIRNRQAPDYFQTFGLGFFEYFQLAEDIGAEPLPILNCGMSCQFNAAEVVPMNELDPYIQDALDLIEFANGPVTTKWGGLRASMGHPSPFNLKYIGIGNEQWEEQYIERYRVFEKVIREKHPEIKIVSGSGPSASGAYFDYAWTELKKLSPDLIDEHYYMPPEWFLQNAERYDSYDRKGIKVFAGEYAAHGKEGTASESRNTWISALSEAAFMTGLERNAEVVHMASYAPLLAHVDAWQWRPDLIWFDNLNVMGSPNYYVQKMFSTHRGTHVVPALSNGKPLTGKDSLYVSSTIDRKNGKLYVKIVNSSRSAKPARFTLEEFNPAREAGIETLRSDDPFSYNSMANPKLIFPSARTLIVEGRRFSITVEPLSANVLVFQAKN